MRDVLQFTRTILFVLMLGVGLACSAETIGWWHFDEQDPGGKTTGADGEIVNAASSEYGAGKVFSADSAGAVGTDANYYPVYSGIPKDANRLLKIYDPMTGETHVNRASLTFVKDGTATANNGGGVRILNNKAFRIPNYTVELFFKSTDATFDTIAPIVGKGKSGFQTESWQIGMLTSGKLFMRYSGAASSTSGSGTAKVNDGQWHHLALVCAYDGSNSTYTMYVDGKEDFSKTKAGETAYATGSTGNDDILVCAYPHKGRKLAGTVDELRISDVALEPEQFLRLMEPACPPVVTDDTLVWMSMDGIAGESLAAYSEGVGGGDANWNETTNSAITATLVRKNDAGTATFDADVKKPFVRIGKKYETITTNTASCLLSPEGTTSGYLFKLSEYNFCATSFTAEMFFRAPTDGGTESQTLLKSNYHFQLTLNGSGSTGKIFFVYWDADQKWTNGGTVGTELRDGQWHHLALVYDQTEKKLKVYLDGAVSKSIDNVTLYDKEAASFIGSSNAQDQIFKGNIDSVRITKRALSPEELLHACKAPLGLVLVVR